jgi:hypothetical protein
LHRSHANPDTLIAAHQIKPVIACRFAMTDGLAACHEPSSPELFGKVINTP